MKSKNVLLVWLAALLFLLACGISVPPSPPTGTQTLAITLSPTRTRTPGPTTTPKPTSTPSPVTVVVTARPAGNAFPFKITDAVGKDFREEDIPVELFAPRIVWVADLKFNYGGGRVLLSGSRDGMKPLVVDDVLTIKILHLDGTFDKFEHDFSFNAPSPQLGGPYDLTDFFHSGLNMLYVTIYDYGYSAWGTEGVWLVEFK